MDEAEWPDGYAVEYFGIGLRCLCCVFLLTVLLIIENGSPILGFLQVHINPRQPSYCHCQRSALQQVQKGDIQDEPIVYNEVAVGSKRLRANLL